VDGIVSWFEFVVDNFDDVLVAFYEHARYVVLVMIAATIVSVSVGIWVRNRPLAREIALGIAAVFLTLPSLALFVLFIPFVGLGFWPSFIALFMYALLPILRNTVTGLNEVSPAVLESARGMGLGSRERLWKIEMPLAWPVVLTGIRVATLLTTGIAAIATLVAGGGLGDFIKDAINRYPLPTSVERVWTGTIFTIILALLLDVAIGVIRRYTTSEGLK
jgi:osmoprotectant transport system permease protein